MKRFMILLFWLNLQAQETPTKDRFDYNYEAFVNYITLSDFRDNQTGSLILTHTISTPGTYVLIDTIYSTVTTGSSSIIYINSDDVLLDLNGNTLYQNNNTANIDGITIASSKNNINIKNGTIRGCKGNGITINQNCSTLYLEDILVTQCLKTGINFAGTSGNEILSSTLQNCTITQVTGDESNDAFGMKMNYCQDITINDCHFDSNKNSNSNRSVNGLRIDNSRAFYVKNCTFNNNKANSESIGLNLQNCSNSFFENCNAFYNNTSQGNAIGFNIYQSSYNFFKNCNAFAQSSNNYSYGFFIQTVYSNTFNSCNSSNNRVTNGNNNSYCKGFGIIGNSNNNQFLTCIANGNVASSTQRTDSYGFDIGDSVGSDTGFNYIQDIQASVNRALGDGTCNSVGLIPRSDTVITSVINGVICSNVGTGADYGYINQAATGNSNYSTNITSIGY